MTPVDAGLLILRVVVGVALVGHGTQKLFGWFGEHGQRGTGAFFELRTPRAVLSKILDTGHS
jgi:uncharacterized membrane protein YphA (DoxX/SURF4 family)